MPVGRLDSCPIIPTKSCPAEVEVKSAWVADHPEDYKLHVNGTGAFNGRPSCARFAADIGGDPQQCEPGLQQRQSSSSAYHEDTIVRTSAMSSSQLVDSCLLVNRRVEQRQEHSSITRTEITQR